jgi:hypothetical protein
LVNFPENAWLIFAAVVKKRGLGVMELIGTVGLKLLKFRDFSSTVVFLSGGGTFRARDISRTMV